MRRHPYVHAGRRLLGWYLLIIMVGYASYLAWIGGMMAAGEEIGFDDWGSVIRGFCIIAGMGLVSFVLLRNRTLPEPPSPAPAEDVAALLSVVSMRSVLLGMALAVALSRAVTSLGQFTFLAERGDDGAGQEALVYVVVGYAAIIAYAVVVSVRGLRGVRAGGDADPGDDALTPDVLECVGLYTLGLWVLSALLSLFVQTVTELIDGSLYVGPWIWNYVLLIGALAAVGVLYVRRARSRPAYAHAPVYLAYVVVGLARLIGVVEPGAIALARALHGHVQEDWVRVPMVSVDPFQGWTHALGAVGLIVTTLVGVGLLVLARRLTAKAPIVDVFD